MELGIGSPGRLVTAAGERGSTEARGRTLHQSPQSLVGGRRRACPLGSLWQVGSQHTRGLYGQPRHLLRVRARVRVRG